MRRSAPRRYPVPAGRARRIFARVDLLSGQVTVAPIYLVSACTSGEEFVAAFRRYADKHGLFVPITTPFAIGRRGRFAVTLRDGGVMVEGEAEVVSAARTPSVLHGRVGMTLRFVEPDAPSKTILAELEKARLSMRPPPPSIAPRPAEIPAAPRPVPPAAQGRIDAVNALAECVAIADREVLDQLALAPPSASPPKAAPRFVAPSAEPLTAAHRPRAITPPPSARMAAITVPASVAPAASTQTSTASAAGAAAPASATSAPVSPAATSAPAAPATPPRAAPASVGGAPALPRPTFGTSSNASLATKPPVVAIIESGPTSDTMVAVAPPEPPGMALGGVTEPYVPVDLGMAVPRTGTRPGAGPAPTPSPPRLPVETPSGPASETMYVAIPRASSPTDIGGLIVEPLAASDSGSVDAANEPTGNTADPAIVVETSARDDASARTQVHAGIPPREPAMTALREPALRAPASPAPRAPTSHAPVSPSAPAAAPGPGALPSPGTSTSPRSFANAPNARTLQGGTLDLTQTVRSAPPEMAEVRAALETRLGMEPARRVPAPEIVSLDSPSTSSPSTSSPSTLRPAPPVVAAARPPVVEVEIAEPTDLSFGPPQPPAIDPPAVDAPTDPEIPRPRKTAVGIAVMPSDVAASPSGSIALPTITPVTAMPAFDASSLAAADEPTGTDPVVDGDPASDEEAGDTGGAARDAPAASDGGATMTPAPADEPTPSEYWTIVPGGSLAPSPKAPRAASRTPTTLGSGPVSVLGAAPASGPVPTSTASAAPGTRPAPPGAAAGGADALPMGPVVGLPSGDWLIALDPGAPDGWSEPFETVPAAQIDGETVDPPAATAAAPVRAPTTDPRTRRPTPRPEVMPRSEPKVQIDPTLIEPLVPLPDDGARTSSPDLSRFGSGGFPVVPLPGGIPATPPFAAPPFGAPTPYGAPHGPPAYPLDPSYQMVPVATLPPPRAQTAGGSGSGFIDPRYVGEGATPGRGRRRHIIIVLATAIVAVVIGIIVLAKLTGQSEPSPPTNKPAPGAATPAPGTQAVTPGARPATTNLAAVPGDAHAVAAVAAPPPAAAATGSPTAATAPTATAPAAPAAAAPAARAAAPACYADIASQPSGAEIVVGASKILGTTPQKLALPCGAKVELTIRKSRLVSATRTITPSSELTRVRVTLGKPTVQVKVSSTPPGATITLNGRSLGVTPTTVKVPAFEASMLSITKDGYVPGTEKVSPKASGSSVHATLKKVERRR